MKIAARTHPKLYDLCDRLKCSRPTAMGYLELLWGGTSDHAPAGDIGKFTDGAIARWCDWTGEPSEFVSALVASGWIDESETHRLLIHDWHEHCPSWLRSRFTRGGFRFATTDEARNSTGEPSPVRTDDPTGDATSKRTGDPTDDRTDTPTTSQAKPSPTKSSQATPSQAAFAESNAWTMAAAAASGFGLATARAKVERCRASGVPVEQVGAALDYWREHSGEFDGAGALGMKLDSMVPGQRVSDGWPKRTRRPTNGVDVGAECDAVRALCDSELEDLARQAFAGKQGLMANWREQGRKSGACVEAIAAFRIRSRNGGV